MYHTVAPSKMTPWLETTQNIWAASKPTSDKEFQKACERCILYLYTVKPSDRKEESRIIELIDILFESQMFPSEAFPIEMLDKEYPDQVSSYLHAKGEKQRMELYVRFTTFTISDIVKMKRKMYIRMLKKIDNSNVMIYSNQQNVSPSKEAVSSHNHV